MSFILILLLYYGLINLINLMLYVIDKSAAMKSKRRVPEKTLHLLAAFGGCFGALAGQHIFRHKTRKLLFVLFAWFCCAAHFALMLYFFGFSTLSSEIH